MQCEEAQYQFADYLSGDLTDPRRSRLREHLDRCETCREEAESLRATWNRLGHIQAAEPDSPAMRARLATTLDEYRQGMDQAAPPAPPAPWIARWWPRQPGLQLGLSAVLAIAGIVIGQQYRRPPEPQSAPAQTGELRELRQELHDMRQMVALSLMRQESASERLKGVSWSNRIDVPDNEVLGALLDTLMHDPNVNVRLAAVDALKQFGQHRIVQQGLREALQTQDTPVVQAALIDYMVEAQDKESIETLREISRDLQVYETVRERAQWGIAHLE